MDFNYHKGNNWSNLVDWLDCIFLADAINSNDANKVRHLVKDAPNLANAYFPGGGLPLLQAVVLQHYELIPVLIKAGADIDQLFNARDSLNRH